MNTSATSNNEHWFKLWDRLHSMRFEPLPSTAEVDDVLNNLPKRQADEDLSHWLAQAKKTVATMLPFKKFAFTKLTELRLKAASSGDHQYPLPDKSLVTPDGAFRFSLSKEADMLNVHLKTLAFATEKYRGQYIGIAAGAEASSLLLAIKLDNKGEGCMAIADSDEVRKILCVNPIFALIEPENA